MNNIKTIQKDNDIVKHFPKKPILGLFISKFSYFKNKTPIFF